MFRHTLLSSFAAIAIALPGCSANRAQSNNLSQLPTPPELASEPIAVQIRRAEPRLTGMPYRVLLDFEKPMDLAFLDQPSLKTSSNKAHSGASSLLVHSQGRSFAVKLSSLVSESLPGPWTLAGAFFYSDAQATVAISGAGQPPRNVPLVAGKWTAVMADLTSLSGDPGAISFSVDAPPGSDVFCDDFVLINNENSVTPKVTNPADPPWTLKQRGFSVSANRPGRFNLTLKTIDERPDGWILLEGNHLRARFVSGDGHEMTLYADGRQYTDGELAMLGPKPRHAETLAQNHGMAAEVTIAEESGRIDRDTPGDQNNDGYNERRGAYQLVANGPRMELTLRPRGGALAVPVLEIAGLKPGTVMANVDGHLVDRSARLIDGRTLIELPLILRRPVTVNIAVK